MGLLGGNPYVLSERGGLGAQRGWPGLVGHMKTARPGLRVSILWMLVCWFVGLLVCWCGSHGGHEWFMLPILCHCVRPLQRVEEPGALERVVDAVGDWFLGHPGATH